MFYPILKYSGLLGQSVHIDTTTLLLHGEYSEAIALAEKRKYAEEEKEEENLSIVSTQAPTPARGYNRIEEYFSDQLGIPISAGSLFNFNEQAAALVKSSGAEYIIKRALQSPHQALHVDETGINIGGKRRWLHGASTTWWTYFYPNEKRGKIVMDEAGILPHFTGVLCHDHWKPYYQYTQCQHALCNAHHIRELERAWEQDGMQWAKDMQVLLKEINK